MPNMTPKKAAMPTQPPEERRHNFREVALGYSAETAMEEATRCLNCKHKPCVSGCPVHIEIPRFIEQVKDGYFGKAYEIISRTSSLPAVCGRVCPQENQCEARCVRGKNGEPAGIGRLERFVADWHNAQEEAAPEKPVSNGHKVAVIGSGPSGLTCAGDLAKMGYEVTDFEARHLAGGVLVYGIPEFRLPKSIVQKEVETIQALGVKIETNMVIGRVLSIDELMDEQGFEAVFIGSGAGLPRFMNIKGENLCGVYSANEFLTRTNLMKAYREESATPIMHAKRVAVVGGGQQMALGEPDASGRRRPVPVEGSEYVIDVDAVIMAIGTSPNPLLKFTTKGLETKSWGGIVADENGQTSREGVFAGGDAVTGAATVILAMGEGKTAAAAIDEYIKNKSK